MENSSHIPKLVLAFAYVEYGGLNIVDIQLIINIFWGCIRISNSFNNTLKLYICHKAYLK